MLQIGTYRVRVIEHVDVDPSEVQDGRVPILQHNQPVTTSGGRYDVRQQTIQILLCDRISEILGGQGRP